MAKNKTITTDDENIPKSSFSTLFFLKQKESTILDSYLEYYNQVKHTTFDILNQNNQQSIEQIATALNLNVINNINLCTNKKLTKQDIIKQYYQHYFNKNITFPFNKFNPVLTQPQNTSIPAKYAITGRQFNSIKFELKAIISSTIELRDTYFKELTQDIKNTNKQINSWCKKQSELIIDIINIIKTIKKNNKTTKDNKNISNKKSKDLTYLNTFDNLDKKLIGIIKVELLKIVKEYQPLLEKKQKDKTNKNNNINSNKDKSINYSSSYSHNKTSKNNQSILLELQPLIDVLINKIKNNFNVKSNVVLLDKEKETIKTKISQFCYAKTREKTLTKKLKNKKNKYNKILWQKLTNTVSICFGSKKLFNQQFLIKDNKTHHKDKTKNKSIINNLDYLYDNHNDVLFKTHYDWKKQWNFKRHQHLNLIGAKAETSGNQSCIARINRKNTTVDNVSFNFDLRLPNKIIKDNSNSYNFYQNKYLQLKQIDFNEFNIILEIILMNQTRNDKNKIEVQEAVAYKISKNQKQPLIHKDLIAYTITFTVNTPKASLIKLGKDRFKLSKSNTIHNQNRLNNEKIILLDKSLGVVGIDLNYDHVAIAETNRHGNLVNTFNLYFNSKVEINKENNTNSLNQLSNTTISPNYGKEDKNELMAILDLNNYNYQFLSKPISHHYHIQSQSSEVKTNMLGNLVKILIDYAKKVGKPIVIEDLDFIQKKKALKENNFKNSTKYKTMLSSFIYGMFRSFLERSCYKHDIELIKVNPIYSSLIGLVNWSQKHSMSIHQGAAFVIARRGQLSTDKTMYIEKIIGSKKITFSYRGLKGSIDLPVKLSISSSHTKDKRNNQALSQDQLNEWKTVQQEVKKTKKEIDKILFLQKQLNRNCVDDELNIYHQLM